MYISYHVRLNRCRVKELFKSIVDHNFQLRYHQMEHYTHGKLFKSNYYYYIFICLCVYIFILFYRRGKGDYFRLGHGTNEHVRKPRPVNGLHGKKVVQFATGSKK